MESKIKYYSKLKRPNNEYDEKGKLIYESQLNKTFDLFLFAMCKTLTFTQKEMCYVNIILDVDKETKEITNVRFVVQGENKGINESFKKTFQRYYGYSLDDEFSPNEAIDKIIRIAPTASDYFSTLPKSKTRADNFYMLRPYASTEGEIGIERGNESPIIRISQDEDKREIIEIMTNDDGYLPVVKCYLDDFLALTFRTSLTQQRYDLAKDFKKP